MTRFRRSLRGFVLVATITSICLAPPPTVAAPPHPNLSTDPPRPVRYRPDGPVFVITNGDLSFNRPLYGHPTAFRVDAGDRPEFSLYLPGRGGVLRLGFVSRNTTKWFTAAARVTTGYEAATLTYTISDPALGPDPLTLTVLAPHDAESLLARLDAPQSILATEFLLAYGGPAGDRARRDGDIGTEPIPVSEYFALRPEHCRDSKFSLTPPTFTVTARTATLAGTTPPGTSLTVADARSWNNPTHLLASAAKPTDTPVVVGRTPLSKDAPTYFYLQRIPANAPPKSLSYSDLPALFARSRAHLSDVSTQIRIDTPDPHLNAAAPALCVAADGVWDPAARAYMHGAVAWRRPLLGWRGLYAGDALGHHDRTRAHLDTFLAKQNTSPFPATQPGPDPNANLARAERALHSNGDLTNSHYDMNLVAIDALLRHLLWTGDRDYAQKVWPALQRHLAWERRLFRRDFGDGLPLYEAYAAIWASDDLQYSGGGVTHATAYNLHHNRMAARVARWIGRDPAPYDAEADAIARALDKHLWLQRQGWFAEFKDYLGNRLVHTSPALWTHYHTIDSHAATPLQCWQMSRYVDTQIPHIPIRTTDPSLNGLSTLSTTNWHPYLWSTNNVVMAEVVHTALAEFQSNRPAQGLATLKAALLDSMYLGQCPGNLGMATFYDPYRRESQRDFADAVGITSRALVEGLFGIHPDLIANTLTIRPGFPMDWNHATLTHPDLTLAFAREGLTDKFSVTPCFPHPVRLILEPLARTSQITAIRVNGQQTKWTVLEDSVAHPRIQVLAEPANRWEIAIEWREAPPPTAPVDLGLVTPGQPLNITMGAASPVEVIDPQTTLSDTQITPNAVRARATGTPGHRTAFVRVRQGDLTWLLPVAFELRDPKPTAVPPAPLDATLCQPVDLSAHFNDSVTDIFRPLYLSPRSPFCSLSLPINGLGGWASNKLTADIDDTGLRAAARSGAGRITLPTGLPFLSPADGHNALFVSQWDHHPKQVEIPLTGRASHAHFLLAGSTTNMQSRVDNGELIVHYADGSTTRLPLHNPTTWWPIEQDYFIDDHSFAIHAPLPARLDLKTLRLRHPAKGSGGRIPGGSATLLHLPLDPSKQLRSLTVLSLTNESVIGLLAVTLQRTAATTNP